MLVRPPLRAPYRARLVVCDFECRSGLYVVRADGLGQAYRDPSDAARMLDRLLDPRLDGETRGNC